MWLHGCNDQNEARPNRELPGNSIPRVVVEQTGLKGELELEVRDRHLVIRPTSHPRAGWEDRLRAMSRRRDDRPLWPETALTSFDHQEWEW
jgi:antitoxin MazE